MSTVNPVPPTVDPDTTSTRRPTLRARERRLRAVTHGAVAAGAVWLLAGPVLGVELGVSDAPGGPVTREIGLAAVLLSALAAGLVGWAVLALLERRTGRAVRIWRGTAVTVALVSLAGPVLQAGSVAAAVTLAVMHLVVAAVLVPGLAGAPRTV